MPTNLPPQYLEAEKVYRQGKTPQEKIEALENMPAIMPKHKGTDHLRGELRARIAKLAEGAEQRQKGGRAQLHHVPKEGAGQVALVGPPNVGKSQLLAALTVANPRVGPYHDTPRPSGVFPEGRGVSCRLTSYRVSDHGVGRKPLWRASFSLV